MKKLIFLFLLTSPVISRAQAFFDMGAGVATFNQNISTESGKTETNMLLLPAVKISGGYQAGSIVLEGEIRPTVTKKQNSSTNLGAKVGYNFNGLIPAAGYYYNYCNSDNPENNTSGIGLSLKYIVQVNDKGGVYFEGMYVNKSYQLTAGFHVQF